MVLEMSGVSAQVQNAFKAARNGGRVTLLGIPSGPIELDVSNDIIFKALRVDGITGRHLWNTWYKTSALVGGVVDVAPLITHEIDLVDFERGFDLMKRGECGKVVMYPGGVPGKNV